MGCLVQSGGIDIVYVDLGPNKWNLRKSIGMPCQSPAQSYGAFDIAPS